MVRSEDSRHDLDYVGGAASQSVSPELADLNLSPSQNAIANNIPIASRKRHRKSLVNLEHTIRD